MDDCTVKKESLWKRVLFKKVEDLRLELKITYSYVKPYIPDELKGQIGAMAYTLKTMYDAIIFTRKECRNGYWRACTSYLRYGKLFLKLVKPYCGGDLP